MSNEIRQYRRKGSDAHWAEHTRETADHWGYFVGSPEYETRTLYTAPQVPEGFALVPVDPTPEMVKAAEEAYMPFGDMELAIQMAIATVLK